MHGDAPYPDGESRVRDWTPYLKQLQTSGHLLGGSAVGGGICVRKAGQVPAITSQITGFIRVGADALDHAASLLVGNPDHEAGGTVGLRELLET